MKKIANSKHDQILWVKDSLCKNKNFLEYDLVVQQRNVSGQYTWRIHLLCYDTV